MNDSILSFTRVAVSYTHLTWKVKFAGAQLASGFGYQYGLKKYKIGDLKVETSYPGQSRFEKDAKGLERAQPNDATIILFDNAGDVMNSPEEQRTFTVKAVSYTHLPVYHLHCSRKGRVYVITFSRPGHHTSSS